MTVEPKPKRPILEVAWTLFVQLDALSKKQSKRQYRWYGWISGLGVFAVFLVVINFAFTDYFLASLNLVLKILLIATLIAVSVLVAFVNNYSRENDWRVSRAGAERVQKDIYVYRTIHKDRPDRREWLEGRLETTQHQVRDGMNGELLLGQPPAKIPSSFDPDNPDSDEGFRDLSGDEYIRYRLEDQLAKNIRMLKQHEDAWTRQQIYILLASGVGILLAAIGGNYSIWVAVTTSLMVVLIGWHGLQNFDQVVKNCRRVISSLMTAYDHWNMIEPEERTNDDFFRLVKSTEKVLLGQDIEYIRSIQDVLAEGTPEVTELIESTLGGGVETDEALKDEKLGSEIMISPQVIQDIFTEEHPEVPELIESTIEDVVEADEAFKDQKTDSEIEVSSQIIEDILVDETLEEPDLVENVPLETIEPIDVITTKTEETAVEKSEELIIEEELGQITSPLAEEASSKLIQAEFAAMAEAASQVGSFAVSADSAEAGRLSDTLDAIAKEFKDVEIGRDTSASVLNDLLSRYPNTNEVKG